MSRQALPIDPYLEKIADQLSSSPSKSLILTAAPGSGKTTRVPVQLRSLTKKKILVLQPRRIAAIGAATFICEENGWQVAGNEVGYQVRFDKKWNSSTQVIFLTEALLNHWLQKDPLLSDVGAVVLDEFHERSRHVDLALGLISELKLLHRPDLLLVVMSATLDPEPLIRYLQAPWIDVPGVSHPLRIHHQKKNQHLRITPDFLTNLVDAIAQAHQSGHKDTLVFLPGKGEIQKSLQLFQEKYTSLIQQTQSQCFTLHGQTPLLDQKKILQASACRRIIFCTNLAESALTIQGVDVVVDTGLERQMHHDFKTGFPRLEIERISLQSAKQRAGRAARLGPGQCFRLWTTQDELSMKAFVPAEILRTEISDSLLFLASMGIHDFQSFSWYEMPSPQQIQSAVEELRSLKALDEKNHITAMGQQILKFPVPARLGKILLWGQQNKHCALACAAAAILHERDFLPRHFSTESFHHECDLSLRLQLFEDFLNGKNSSFSLRLVQQNYHQFLNLLSAEDIWKEWSSSDIQDLILSVYPDRLCQRRSPGKPEGKLRSGRGVKLQNTSCVRQSEYWISLESIETDQGKETMVSMACGIPKDKVLSFFQNDIREKEHYFWQEDQGRMMVQKQKVLDEILFSKAPALIAKGAEAEQHLQSVAIENFEKLMLEEPALKNWLLRWDWLLQVKKQELCLERQVLFSDLVLRESFEMACYQKTNLKDIFQTDLIPFLESSVKKHWPEVFSVFQKIPQHLTSAKGKVFPIQFSADSTPFVEMKIQDLFGMKQTPQLLPGIPLRFQILGPHYRPVQITDNLERFWQQSYPELRKELKARYPKHPWPENP